MRRVEISADAQGPQDRFGLGPVIVGPEGEPVCRREVFEHGGQLIIRLQMIFGSYMRVFPLFPGGQRHAELV